MSALGVWHAVWDGYFADPFVLKTPKGFFAFGTDGPDDIAFRRFGLKFPVLFSADLTSWEFVGGALTPEPSEATAAHWAPEVAFADGQYVMFYSSGGPNGEDHAIQMAVSPEPQGPFEVLERSLLPSLGFSIDGHPFLDPLSGKRFLYFARDYLSGPIGTGLAVVTMRDDFLAPIGNPKAILRASAEWQIFERNRFWYGKTWRKWHTCEGPAVLFRDDQYWLFYSGGNWQDEGYGIGLARSNAPLGPFAEIKHRVLTGFKGPGHCSFFTDASDNSLVAFHAWNAEGDKRQMYLARIDWKGGLPQFVPL